MFVTIIGTRVFVKLSRRNLQQLEAILAKRETRNEVLVRNGENGMSLVVHVEDDAEHYGRDPVPGMSWPA